MIDNETELPDYYKTFKKRRVGVYGVLNQREIERRLGFELRLPINYVRDLISGYNRVMQDAFEHGEGIRILNLGIFRFVSTAAAGAGSGQFPPKTSTRLKWSRSTRILQHRKAIDKLLAEGGQEVEELDNIHKDND
jgi:hypothetical protein